MSSLRAYGKNVLVMVIPPKQQHSKLLIIPDGYQKESNQGIVVQTGADVRYVEKGQMIVYDQSRGEAITDKNGTLFYILPERAISCSLVMEPFVVDGLFHRGEDIEVWIDGQEDGDGIFVQQETYFPATSESIFQLLKEAWLEQPRVIQNVIVIESDTFTEEETNDD